jgi:pentatricopeptide repeat protein
MSERNLVSWSAMISGYEQIGEPISALGLFSKLNIVPNEYVYASVISACASLKGLVQGKQIHGQALKFGLDSVSFVSNALITMYMKCGKCSDALLAYNEALELNPVAYNALITGFVENQQPDKGFEVLRMMYQDGFFPDRFTFVGLLGTCNSRDDLKRGELLHCQTIKLKLNSTAFIGNLIITMYSKLNLLEEAEKAFRSIEEKDLISWNTFISSCSHCNDHEKALEAFKEMLNECRVRPDEFTFASALAACSGLASMCNGKQIHGHLIRTRLFQDVGAGNALINMYAKCGCIAKAYYIFSKMEHQNLVSWNTMIAGFGNHGFGGKAFELFAKMKTMGVKPDSVTFVGLLTASNHAGLVDEGLVYFNSMEETYGISPEIEHFSCLIDLLGRAGRLNEAKEYMKKFPFGHDTVVLGSLLSACRLHGDVDTGKCFARQLLKLQPATTSPYVLLSNLYASDEMWDGVAEAWKLLKGSGLKKEPGHSLIEVNGTFEKFTVVDFSHSRIEEIMDMLKTLRWAAIEV